MRPIELGGFLIAIVPILAMLALLPVWIGIVAAGLSAGILLGAALWIGAYWQLIPLYAGVLLVLLGLIWWKRKEPRRGRIALAIGVVCLLILTAGFTYVLPMFPLPEPTGSYATGTRILHLVDPVRKETHVAGSPRPREIMVQVWYPATPNGQPLASYRRYNETSKLSSYMAVLWTHSYLNAPVATEGAPFPVLLFNPAWNGQRTQNTYQVEDLASHGFVVVGIDHPYNSGPIAFPDGRVVGIGKHDITNFSDTTLAQQFSIGNKELQIQVGDDALVLNYLSAANQDSGSPLFHRVNVNDTGAFGHSFGGAVSAEIGDQDPRVKAVLNEDGWMFGSVYQHGLDKPYLFMDEDSPAITQAQLQSTDSQTRRQAHLLVAEWNSLTSTMHQFGGYYLMIRGSKHDNFRDRSLYTPLHRLTDSGSIPPERAHQIIEAYTLEFFEHYLKGKLAPLLAATDSSPYREVQFENWFKKNASTH